MYKLIDHMFTKYQAYHTWSNQGNENICHFAYIINHGCPSNNNLLYVDDCFDIDSRLLDSYTLPLLYSELTNVIGVNSVENLVIFESYDKARQYYRENMSN
ncbi:hypothetical protein HYPBUDRAFT_6154 [Hyphopichia burtonii NRRL Y-1933]|uniref:Uncharacterized protein n=1 Tax=Hyphopichia burtonii NRRL Y-1933 TaxID=984485 RepID=A0A1E4RHV5_9ASCO|nr:hypothetical protein HYPBUDRAFT_6154 [Hyphopichia burtonii NRRL Y-1933]ODV66838.1 hypothetical protein HYPBUDRAFT_6154 [Hyphopichia burtonii NRRL Y-1933]